MYPPRMDEMSEPINQEILLAQGHGGGHEAVEEAGHQVAEEVGHHVAEAAGHGDHFEFAHLFHHMEDQVLVQIPPVQLGGISFDFSITKFILMMWVAGLLSLLIFSTVARRIRGGGAPRGVFANLFESLFLFVRNDMVYDMMGEKTGRKFAPYFVSLFFFILFCNLLGLIPFMATATGNLAVTGGLAVLTFLMTQVSGMRAQGVLPYLKNIVPPGLPILLFPIMLPIEIMGHFTKPFALTVRLFANMTGGHVIILSLIGLIFMFKAIWVAPIAIGFVLFIDFLELLVAFLQAYVFVLLSILFVNSAVHPDH